MKRQYLIFFRFRLESDSVETNQEGWMIDDLNIYGTLIDNLNELTHKKETVTIYPNPTKDKLFLNFSDENNELISITTLDRNGMEVRNLQLNKSQKKIDISDFNEGVYIIKIEGKEFQLDQVFVKE